MFCLISFLQANERKCIDLERFSISKAWGLISICLGDINTNLLKLKTWSTSPLGKGLALNLLKQFEEYGDIQSIALFSALILGCETKMMETIQKIA